MNVLAIVTATLKNFSTLSQGLHGKRFFYQEVSFILHPFRLNTSIFSLLLL